MKQKIDRIFEMLKPKVLTGTADVDVSAYNYTADYVELLKIQAPSAYGLNKLIVDLDLNKATTGWDAVSTAADTLNITAKKKTDGTNYRTVISSSQFTAVGAGGHQTAGVRFDFGAVRQGEEISIRVKLSAERADFEVPYRITYCGEVAPTVTPVAAG